MEWKGPAFGRRFGLELASVDSIAAVCDEPRKIDSGVLSVQKCNMMKYKAFSCTALLYSSLKSILVYAGCWPLSSSLCSVAFCGSINNHTRDFTNCKLLPPCRGSLLLKS
jgi:hypothetical protein